MTISPLYTEIKGIIERRIKSRDPKDVFLATAIITLFDIHTSTQIETACASLSKNGAGVISINPAFWETLTRLEVKDNVPEGAYKFVLLCHEFLHIHLDHIKRFPLNNPSTSMIINLALDISINQLLPYIQDKNTTMPGINLHKAIEKFKPLELDKLQNAEYYYRKILEFKQNYPDKFKSILLEYMDHNGNGDVEDHQMHQDESTELHREEFTQNVSRIASSLKYNGESLNLDFSHKPVLPWKRVLGSLCNHAVQVGRKNLYSRPNKRKGYPYPKRISDKKVRAAILLDNSWSMSGILPKILTEIKQITKAHKTHMDLYTVNVELQYVGELNSVNADSLLSTVRQGGGTDFSKTLPELTELIGNIPIIFITDTEGEFPEKKPANHIVIIATAPVSNYLTSKQYRLPIINAQDMLWET